MWPICRCLSAGPFCFSIDILYFGTMNHLIIPNYTKMKYYICFLFLLPTIISAQTLTQKTDLHKTTLEFDNQVFFEFENNTYEYHTSGRNVIVTNPVTGDEVYRSRVNLCDQDLFSIAQRNGQMIYPGAEGVFVENIFTEEEQFIPYIDFAIEPYLTNGPSITYINRYMTINNQGQYLVMDLDRLEFIANEDRNYKFKSVQNYYYQLPDRVIQQDVTTLDTSTWMYGDAYFQQLQEQTLVHFRDDKTIFLNNQDEIIGDINIEEYLLRVSQTNDNTLVLFTRLNSIQSISYYDLNSFQLISKHTIPSQDFPYLASLHSTHEGIYLSDSQGSGYNSLYYWEYGKDSIEVILEDLYDLGITPIINVTFGDDHIVLSSNKYIIVDKHTQEYKILENDITHTNFFTRDKFTKVNDEEVLIFTDKDGFAFGEITPELNLEDLSKVNLEDGLGQILTKRDDIYLLSKRVKGLKRFEYLYGDPLEIKTFESSGYLLSDIIVTNNKIFYHVEDENDNPTIWEYDPSTEEHKLLIDNEVEFRTILQKGPFLLYNDYVMYNILTGEFFDCPIENIQLIRSISFINNGYFYGKIGLDGYRVPFINPTENEKIFDGNFKFGGLIFDNQFVLRNDENLFIAKDDDYKLIAYPDGYGIDDIKIFHQLILATQYDDITNFTNGYRLNFNSDSWIPISFEGRFNNVKEGHIWSITTTEDGYKGILTNVDTESTYEEEFSTYPFFIASDKTSIYIPNTDEKLINVYNYKLEKQTEIEVPTIKTGIFFPYSLSHNSSHVLLLDYAYTTEPSIDLKTFDFYVLNTRDNTVSNFGRCDEDDLYLENFISYGETMELLYYSEEDGYQIFTHTFEDFGSTSTKDEIINPQELFSIYPNPTDGIINLERSAEKIEISGFDGRLILSKNDSKSINISLLPSGIYSIKAIVENQAYTEKVVKW